MTKVRFIFLSFLKLNALVSASSKAACSSSGCKEADEVSLLQTHTVHAHRASDELSFKLDGEDVELDCKGDDCVPFANMTPKDGGLNRSDGSDGYFEVEKSQSAKTIEKEQAKAADSGSSLDSVGNSRVSVRGQSVASGDGGGDGDAVKASDIKWIPAEMGPGPAPDTTTTTGPPLKYIKVNMSSPAPAPPPAEPVETPVIVPLGGGAPEGGGSGAEAGSGGTPISESPGPSPCGGEDADTANYSDYKPAHTGCMPTCSWQCNSTKCDEKCRPKCKDPKCHTRCSTDFDPASCHMECLKPHCAVVCPTSICARDDCPKCMTSCSEPVCKMKCKKGNNPCTNVCKMPDCIWDCKAPEATECPQPKCGMACEEPPSCFQGQLSLLEIGHEEAKSFKQSDRIWPNMDEFGYKAPSNLAETLAQARPGEVPTMRVPVTRETTEGSLENYYLELPVKLA